MERVFRATLTSLLLLLLISNTRGRLLPSHQDENLSTKHNGNIQVQQSDSALSLMGLDMEEEECSGEDEACEKRRMVAEAHLDYIYTQHQHP